jgi:hypothetical protein
MAVQPSWQSILSADSWARLVGQLAAHDSDWDVISTAGIPFWSALGQPPLERIEASSPFVGTVLLWAYVVVAQVSRVRPRIPYSSGALQRALL